MPSWFSKVFKETDLGTPARAGTEAPREEVSLNDYEDEEEFMELRRVVQALVVVDEEETSGWSADVRIKAKYDPVEDKYTLLVDRPVLEGLSFWCPDPETAYAQSPLAAAIFELGGVRSVLIHEMTLTVTRDGVDRQPWEAVAKAIGTQIRAHLKSGMPVVNPEWRDRVPNEAEIRDKLQAVIDEELNPGIASHSGVIILNRVKGNTAFITMGGGCQGCAASSVTLRGGVEQLFRGAVPELGAILDETDHLAGTNPYFRELPAGMGG